MIRDSSTWKKEYSGDLYSFLRVGTFNLKFAEPILEDWDLTLYESRICDLCSISSEMILLVYYVDCSARPLSEWVGQHERRSSFYGKVISVFEKKNNNKNIPRKKKNKKVKRKKKIKKNERFEKVKKKKEDSFSQLLKTKEMNLFFNFSDENDPFEDLEEFKNDEFFEFYGDVLQICSFFDGQRVLVLHKENKSFYYDSEFGYPRNINLKCWISILYFNPNRRSKRFNCLGTINLISIIDSEKKTFVACSDNFLYFFEEDKPDRVFSISMGINKIGRIVSIDVLKKKNIIIISGTSGTVILEDRTEIFITRDWLGVYGSYQGKKKWRESSRKRNRI